MTSTPTVSIIVPNRNYAAFIPDAIASIKAQTLTDWECIIVDDASTDNSVDVFKNLIAGDDRFKLVANTEAIGISAARNIGLNMATGEYIAFLDSDDCYAEFFLEMLVGIARRANVPVAGCLNKIVDEKFHFQPSGAKWNTHDYVVFEKTLEMAQAPQSRKWIWIWRKIYKRDLLKDVRFREEMKINGDDVMFLLDLSYRVPCVAESNIEGIYHRTHSSSVTKGLNIERIKTFPLMLQRVKEDLLDKYDKDFWRWYYNGIFLGMLQESLVKYCDQLTPQDKQDLKKIISDACKKVIVKKYLPFKSRLLCRYLKWIK